MRFVFPRDQAIFIDTSGNPGVENCIVVAISCGRYGVELIGEELRKSRMDCGWTGRMHFSDIRSFGPKAQLAKQWIRYLLRNRSTNGPEISIAVVPPKQFPAVTLSQLIFETIHDRVASWRRVDELTRLTVCIDGPTRLGNIQNADHEFLRNELWHTKSNDSCPRLEYTVVGIEKESLDQSRVDIAALADIVAGAVRRGLKNRGSPKTAKDALAAYCWTHLRRLCANEAIGDRFRMRIRASDEYFQPEDLLELKKTA